VMRESQTLWGLTATAMLSFAEALAARKPDVVLVQGDTTTAMVCGLTSFYQKVAVGHIEAGLRTGNRYSPFPEEVNRRLLSVLSSYNFAPTAKAAEALLTERVPWESVFVTGNTIVDALLMISEGEHEASLGFEPRDGDKLILVTAYRRENLGQPLENICQALLAIVERHPEVQVLYPVHPNPAVRDTVYRTLDQRPRVHLVDPLDYQSLAYAIKRCYLVLTDSGGIQEEAPVFGKPVLVMREETERPEGVEAGVAKVVGTDLEAIVGTAEALLDDPREYDAMSQAVSPYGDGRAAQRIVRILLGETLSEDELWTSPV